MRELLVTVMCHYICYLVLWILFTLSSKLISDISTIVGAQGTVAIMVRICWHSKWKLIFAFIVSSIQYALGTVQIKGNRNM